MIGPVENPVTLETEANWVQFALLPGIMVWRRTRETRETRGTRNRGENTERNACRDQLVAQVSHTLWNPIRGRRGGGLACGGRQAVTNV